MCPFPRLPLYLLLPLAALVATGCGPTDVRADVVAGNYAAAAATLDDDHNSTVIVSPQGAIELDVDDNEALLWALERGLLARLAGDLDVADALFDEASHWAEHYRTKWRAGQVAKELAAATFNDTVTPYEGAGYEHIQIDVGRVLNQLARAQAELGWYAPPAAEGQVALVANDVEAGRRFFEQAISYARHMTRKELLEVEYDAGRQRYDDDPFARVLAAATMLAGPDLGSTDRQFAHVMLDGALKAYAAERERLSGQKQFTYEVDSAGLQIARTLYMRNGLEYFQGGEDREFLLRSAAEYGIAVDNDQQIDQWLAGDQFGSVLVLNQADFVARTEQLQIGIVSGGPPRGATRFTIGGVGFWARGPGAEIVNAWGAFPVPARLTQLLSPGGLAVVTFEIPVHEKDRANPQPFAVRATAMNASTTREAPGGVVSDVDAYARATLKDAQPAVVVKTLLRSLIKQAAVAAAANEASKQNAWLGAAVNIGGSLAMSATEQADLRAAHLLPNRVEAALLDLPPGQHRLQASVAGTTVDLGTVDIVPGRMVIVAMRSFPTPIKAAE